MKTIRGCGAVIDGQYSMTDLEAPKDGARPFLGGAGWLGVQCGCGQIFSARSMGALEAALLDHQEPETCPWHAEQEKLSAEEPPQA